MAVDKWSSDHSPFTSNPPTTGGVVAERSSMWPVSLGVICVIYALAVMACNCAGLFTAQIYQWIMELEQQYGQRDEAFIAQADVVMRMAWAYIGLAALAIIATAGLLWAGIGLIRRQSWSRVWLLAWALAEIFLIVMHCGIELLAAQQTEKLMQQRGLQSEIARMWIESIATMCVLSVLSLILPMLLLIWFNRVKIKNEVAEWV